MAEPSEAKTQLDADPSAWKTVRITRDNWRDVLFLGSVEAIRRGLHRSKAFGPAKIGIGTMRGLGHFAIENSGDTNNYYYQMMNVSTEELNRLKNAAEELKRFREENSINIDARTITSGGGGTLSTGDSRGDSPQPAVLAPKSDKDLR